MGVGGFSHVSYPPHVRPIPRTLPSAALQTYSNVHAPGIRKTFSGFCLVSAYPEEKNHDENFDCSGRNACPGDRRWRGRPPAPTARLQGSSGRRQNADWQGTNREEPGRQGTGLGAVLIRVRSRLSSMIEERSV